MNNEEFGSKKLKCTGKCGRYSEQSQRIIFYAIVGGMGFGHVRPKLHS